MTTTATAKTTYPWFLLQANNPFVAVRAEFEFSARKWVALRTRLQGEPIEIYEVTEGGLEMFAGYLSEVIKTAPKLAVAACEALSSQAVA